MSFFAFKGTIGIRFFPENPISIFAAICLWKPFGQGRIRGYYVGLLNKGLFVSYWTLSMRGNILNFTWQYWFWMNLGWDRGAKKNWKFSLSCCSKNELITRNMKVIASALCILEILRGGWFSQYAILYFVFVRMGW